jgi:putative ATP-binding cassette transporter
MDWNRQLLASLIWLAETFTVSMVGFGVIAAALSRWTDWGRQFRRISWDYFCGDGGAKRLLRLAFVILMTLFTVRMDVLMSFWNNGFYSALQEFDTRTFWALTTVFAVLASAQIVRALLTYYVTQAFMIRWRIWLTEQLLARWIANHAYYRTQYLPGNDNPDQRIQQDIETFVEKSLSLSMGLLNSTVTLISFSIILWNLSGVLTVFGHDIPRAIIYMVYLYIIVSTVFALKIGRPLIRLNFLAERFSADFRYALIRLREYGESIAFYQGETVEHGKLLLRFGSVIGNAWDIVFRTLKFQGFNQTVSQAMGIFPIVVQAPRLFARQIALGDVTQTAAAFGAVEASLSFFRNVYDSFAAYRAVLERLSGFLDAIESAQALGGVHVETSVSALTVTTLMVKHPDGSLIVKALDLDLQPGATLLIRGPSGIGKTTVLRAIAGLWPYADGHVAGPPTLFLPQKPYLPLGTLRQALHYPDPAPGAQLMAYNEQAIATLRLCQLSHLTGRLDEQQDWTRILSLGEQQRLAIGRVMLNRPALVFLDEASSAMDEGLEHAMYELLRTTLPDTILVSVGHRSTLLEFHAEELVLRGGGDWSLQATGR